MAALTVKHILDAGTSPATQNSTASDTADLGDGHNTWLEYTNTGGSDVTITITPVVTLSNGSLYPAKSWTVPATTGKIRIPLRKEYDNGEGANQVTVTAGSGYGANLQVALVRADW